MQRRLLETIGAETSAAGVAAVAYELAGDLTYGDRHIWLLVSTNSWGYFTELVTTRIRAAYKTTIGKGGKRVLAGIAEASSRRELAGEDERDEP